MSDKILVDEKRLDYLEEIISELHKSSHENLKTINDNVLLVDNKVEIMHLKHDELQEKLKELADNFEDFVKKDRMQKALQLAESRIGNLKQDLQIKYGYYAEIRRLATGILQGIDTGVISDDVLRYVTEEVMLKAPGYWLAPALVALASWIRNDKDTHQKALNEALKRDDYKTTLFFMLVMTRLKRHEASIKWLERYFLHQDPHALDREFIIVLEAITKGIFPPASKTIMNNHIKKWLEKFTESDEFVDEQKQQWLNFFDSLGVFHNEKYVLLEKFATNWDELQAAMAKAKSHKEIYNHFENILLSKNNSNKEPINKLDTVLHKLVTNFDDEELPLQKEVRLNELIVKTEGDMEAATKMLDAEIKVFDEQINFLQLLTNASFNAELSDIDPETQSLAVSIGIPWISEAYDTHSARTISEMPVDINFSIDNFQYTTQNGDNEEVLVKELTDNYKKLLSEMINKLSFPMLYLLGGIGVIALSIYSVHDTMMKFVFIFMGAGLIWFAFNKHKKEKEALTNEMVAKRNDAREVLRGCLAETVDYRNDLKIEESFIKKVNELLNTVTPENFTKTNARNIIKN